MFQDLLERRQAVLLGHGDVKGHDVGPQRLILGHGFDTVCPLADYLVAALGEHVGQHLAHEGGVVHNENACHQLVPPGISVSATLPAGSTDSIRTAHSSSTRRSLPVAKRRPLTYRSTGSSGARSRSTTAPVPRLTARPTGICVRPSSAQTRTGIARICAPEMPSRPSRSRWPPASSAASSSSACVMRTTNALGTSWSRRHGSPSRVKPTLVMCGVSS